MQAQDRKNVNYKVQYNSTCTTAAAPDPLPLNASSFATALDIMQTAAMMDTIYEFSVTYGTIGYYVDAIGGISSAGTCYWDFYVVSGGVERAPDVGVAAYVPGNNFDVILRYEQEVDSPTITTTYNIEHQSPCTRPSNQGVRVTTPPGSTALGVMERAVLHNGSMYGFATNYAAFPGSIPPLYGYIIKQVGGVSENGSCRWTVHVTPRNGNEFQLSVPVSAYILPETEYILTLRLSEQQPLATTTTTTTNGAMVIIVHVAIAIREKLRFCGGS